MRPRGVWMRIAPANRRSPHMQRTPSLNIFTTCLASLSAVALVACFGDGDGEETPPPGPTTLAGVVAVGSPLAGATVAISDADTTTADVSTTTAADGSYSADVSTLKAPLLVKASGMHEGAPAVQWAVVPDLAANASNAANVTPLTTGIA